jgi:hypothetical protein
MKKEDQRKSFEKKNLSIVQVKKKRAPPFFIQIDESHGRETNPWKKEIAFFPFVKFRFKRRAEIS